MKKYFYCVLLFLSMSPGIVLAQVDSLDTDLLDLTLEQLMNIQVVSASKKKEKLFDAPLSASVLTWEEIQKSGVTSIPEALRLMPGLIVRQETNGNYDVHIRGLDNVPPYSQSANSANTTTLVMINNRPVYNYLIAGTWWETLPVDLIDIDRIEVVRGTSSTLYGPNAVSGVINIITLKTHKNGLNIFSSAQQGSLNTTLANASIGYQLNKKFSATVSGNYQGRGKEMMFFHPEKDRYFNTIDSLDYSAMPNKDPKAQFPHADRSMDKYGANLFIDYNVNNTMQFSLSTGIQNSECQNAYNPSLIIPSLYTSLAAVNSRTKYVDLKAKAKGLTGEFSYQNGKQNSNIGFIGHKYHYDFSTIDANIEYELKVLNNLSLKPGLNYRSATYDESPYIPAGQRLFNENVTLETLAASLRFDYTAFENKLRLVGGTRADKYNYPDRVFLSYQFAASYKILENHLIRAVYSRAYRSAFILDTYTNVTLSRDVSGQPSPMGPLPPGSRFNLKVEGNKNLDMVKSDMIEFGYRGKLADNLSVDLEAYSTITKNYTNLEEVSSSVVMGQNPSDPPVTINSTRRSENIPLSVHQLGSTLSINYVLKHFQLKPFVTLQNTKLTDIKKDSTFQHKFTPKLYGGFYANYQISNKFNLNVNAYFYSAQTFYHIYYTFYNDGVRGKDDIKAKVIVNTKLSYSPIKQFSVFVSVMNLLNDESREYFKTDDIGRMFLGGVAFKY